MDERTTTASAYSEKEVKRVMTSFLDTVLNMLLQIWHSTKAMEEQVQRWIDHDDPHEDANDSYVNVRANEKKMTPGTQEQPRSSSEMQEAVAAEERQQSKELYKTAQKFQGPEDPFERRVYLEQVLEDKHQHLMQLKHAFCLHAELLALQTQELGTAGGNQTRRLDQRNETRRILLGILREMRVVEADLTAIMKEKLRGQIEATKEWSQHLHQVTSQMVETCRELMPKNRQ